MFYGRGGEEYLVKASPTKYKFHPTPMPCAGTVQKQA